MNYLSEMLKLPVVDAAGEKIGVVNDLGIATGEVFPRVTALAFQGPGKTPFMISWRKYVERFDEDGVYLKYPATDIRFSYLQPDEVLLARDIMNKQIVDTQGMKVVRVNDIKLSTTGENQLRLLGAEVGARGLLRAIHPLLERVSVKIAKMLGKPLAEDIIAWSYMDLLERSTKQIKLSVSHKTLSELHPADIADIIEQLDPRLRGQVVSELDDEKAEKLLRLMGVKEERAIRQLLGYKDDTAGRIMTSEFVSLSEDATVADAIERLRNLDEDVETVHYVYLCDEERHLKGVLSLLAIVTARPDDRLGDLVQVADLITASPEDDQEDVAEDISKYNLLAMPVVDEKGRMLGIVTVDEMWFFFWVAGMLALALLAPTLGRSAMWGLEAAMGLPVALRAADTMVRYATNFFLEYDEDDEDAPSVLGTGLKVAAATVILGFASAPAYLLTLRRRDDAGLDTSGLSLRVTSLAIACVLFVALTCAAATIGVA